MMEKHHYPFTATVRRHNVKIRHAHTKKHAHWGAAATALLDGKIATNRTSGGGGGDKAMRIIVTPPLPFHAHPKR